VLISSLVYPLAIYGLFTEIIPKLTPISPDISSKINQIKYDLIVFLGICQLGVMSIVFVLSIVISHKIAGPLYKLSQYLKSIKDDNPKGKLFFRKGDYFQEIAESYNDAFEHIQECHKNDFVYLSEVSTYLGNLSSFVPEDKRIVISEINKKLSEIQERFRGI